MATRSIMARLTGIVDAVKRIQNTLQEISLDAFEADWQKKARHPSRPWQKVAGIGNVLRHD